MSVLQERQFQVGVTTTALGSAGEPQYEHLVDVLASSPEEAELIGTQMAAARADLTGGKDHLMPLASRVIWEQGLRD